MNSCILNNGGRDLRVGLCLAALLIAACSSSNHKSPTTSDGGAGSSAAGHGASGAGGGGGKAAGMTNTMTPKDAGGGGASGASAGSSGASGGSSGASGGSSGASAGSGGAGGSGANDGGTDAGTHDAGNLCANVANPCATAGVTCSGTTLTTCAANADGCLVGTTADCTLGGNNRCNATTTPQKCDFDPCLGRANPCTTAGTSCNATTNVLTTCAANGDGCLVNTTTNCLTGGKNYCSSAAPAACVFDKCRDAQGVAKANVCATSADSCAGDIWVHCVADGDQCLIATRTDCTTEQNKNYCNATTKACALNVCKNVTNCSTPGSTCDGVNRVVCAPDTNSCLVKTTTNCNTVAANDTCVMASGTASCQPCTNASACGSTPSTACQGTNNNTFLRCSDTDGDTCMNAVTETCGTNFTCDATNGCVYSGSTSCTSGIEDVLRQPGSYGTYDTTGGGNDYANYACPPLAPLTVGGASPDRLFAIDVAPRTTVTITITSPTGFTSGSPPFLFLLTSCSDPSTCQSWPTASLDYTNGTTTDVRIYVVVDADQPGTANSVGSFGLTLDSHALACGDGHRDGSEACDDGNRVAGDGCSATCTTETGYACTTVSPSVCTRRPTNNVCANVTCPAAAAGTTLCCTTDQLCGVAYNLAFGYSCIELNQAGKTDTSCPNATSASTAVLPTLTGCCRPDDKCGLMIGNGAGCVERTVLWTDMLDGAGGAYYSGPFDAKSCTY